MTGTATGEGRDWAALVAPLPAGQRRVALLMVEGPRAPTYCEAAAHLEIHIGTVYTHLRRIRAGRPEVYAAIMERRGELLARRPAQDRGRERTRRWRERQARAAMPRPTLTERQRRALLRILRGGSWRDVAARALEANVADF